MIFVTLGSQKFQFNRLLKAVDDLKLDEEVFAQIGFSNYKPVHYATRNSLIETNLQKSWASQMLLLRMVVLVLSLEL